LFRVGLHLCGLRRAAVGATWKKTPNPYWFLRVFLLLCVVASTGCPWRIPAVDAVPSLPGGEVTLLESPSPEPKSETHVPRDGSADVSLDADILDRRDDPDPRVRAAALPLVARSGRPEADDYVVAALDDHDLHVRLAAVAALGDLPADDASGPLEAILDHDSELMRAAAVKSLASLGCEKAVLSAAGDKSWRVRLAVAEAVAKFPDRGAAAVAATMLDDPSAPVQQQTVASIADWPLEQAGPLLLDAMGRAVYMTRKSAAEQLARRWPPAGQFPVDAPPDRRAETLEELRRQFREQIGFVDEATLAAASEPVAESTPRKLARVEQLVERISNANPSPEECSQAVAELKGMGRDAIESLEHLARQRSGPLPEVVYGEVLPLLLPVFAELERMRSDDAVARRHAAGRLAEMSRKEPIGRLAMTRLAEVASTETDALVWQSVLTAMAGDGSEPAVRLAAIAIGHPAPEVRRRACEHLAGHPAAGHAALLIPALKDPNDTVAAAAAAAALGQLGRLDDSGPLRRLLASSNEMVRLDTAVALARLGDEAGRAALERLSYSNDERVRRRVAVAMGDVPDRSFVPALIRLLDDRQSIRVAALASLPKVVGHDVTGPDGESPRFADRIALWKRWHVEQCSGL